MKYRAIILLFISLGMSAPTYAAGDSLASADTMNYVGYSAIVFMLLLLTIVLIVLLKTTKMLSKIILKYEGYTAPEIETKPVPEKVNKKPKAEVWNKLMSLRPLSEEKDMIMEHEYDGIQELDNPTPAWFMYLFYASIIFAVGYLLNYHVFHTGQLQYQEYQTEVKQADIAKQAFLS